MLLVCLVVGFTNRVTDYPDSISGFDSYVLRSHATLCYSHGGGGYKILSESQIRDRARSPSSSSSSP